MRQKPAAWGVHLFTAMGAVCGLLMLEAIFDRRWSDFFAVAGVAVLIDAVDGFLARLALRVKERLPNLDGTLLDNIVDYPNYVLIPAMFLVRADLLPAGWALPAAGLICVASAFQFCQGDAKTADHYFKGFPSYWNIVAGYLLLLELDRWANLAIVVVLALLVFVPIKYIYPSRTKRQMGSTLALTIVWGGMFVAALLLYPEQPPWLAPASLVYVAYYVGLSVCHTLRPA